MRWSTGEDQPNLFISAPLPGGQDDSIACLGTMQYCIIMKALRRTRVPTSFRHRFWNVCCFSGHNLGVTIGRTQMVLETATIHIRREGWTFQELRFYTVDPRRSFSIFSIDTYYI